MNAKNPTREWVATLLSKFSGQENILIVPRPYIAMTGSIEAALLLSQIIYWTDRTKDSDGWIAKSYAEWEQELTLTKYQVGRAMKVLRDAGVETKVRKFKGAPTVHYRLDREIFSQWIVKKLNDPKLSFLTIDSQETSRSYTDTTAKTTAKRKQRTPKIAKGVIRSDGAAAIVTAWAKARGFTSVSIGAPVGSKEDWDYAERIAAWPVPPTENEIRLCVKQSNARVYLLRFLESDVVNLRAKQIKKPAQKIEAVDFEMPMLQYLPKAVGDE